MEGAAAVGRVGTIPGHFSWNDVGDWDTLATVLAQATGENVVLGEDRSRHLAVDTHNSLISPGGERIIATVGVRDIIVFDTPDALLVCARDRAQEVKQLVETLKAQERALHL